MGIQRFGYHYHSGYGITNDKIDDITMSYSGNQLKKICDFASQSTVLTTNDFRDIQSSSYPVEYLYDRNGNMTADLNKGIAWIRYNSINLPDKIQFQNGTKSEYKYDAAGVKRSAGYNYSTNTALIPLGDTDPQKENMANSSYRLDYCGNYIYEKSGTLNPRLSKIRTPEGYINTTYGAISYMGYWNYTYNLTDYQGNTRVYITSDQLRYKDSKKYTASQQIDYYPFGMERSNTGQTSGGVFNSGANPYLYSGNEIDRMNGLNLFDFNARWLDAAVPGFTSIDPLAERHFGETPYSYCAGDPINRIDPLGLDWYQTRDGKSLIYVRDYNKPEYKYNNKDYFRMGSSIIFNDQYGHKWYGDNMGYLSILLDEVEVVAPQINKDKNYLLFGIKNIGSTGNNLENGPSGQGGNLLKDLTDITGWASTIRTAGEMDWNSMTKAQQQKVAYNMQKSLKSNGTRMYTRDIKANINGNFKSLNYKLGAASVVLIGADIWAKGEIRPSHAVNAIMTGVGLTVWGSPVAAGYFLIDFGMGAFYDGGLSGFIDDKWGSPLYDF